MDKKKVKELIEQIQKYCDQCYNPNWQPKSFEEFVKLGNICREAIKELSKSDWVSVEDGLPPYCKNVLVIPNGDKANLYVTARVRSHSNYELDANGFIKMMPFLDLPITHWKPIEKLEE